jgi:DNA-binding response OmpR family regulator
VLGFRKKQTGRRKILVIDDDEMTLTLMQQLLHEEGYEIFSTADGPQGIAIYKQRRPEVVLRDLGLPSMNGLEVLRRLRSIDDNAKVIVITGHGSEESAEVALMYGALEYVRKPVDQQSLLQLLKSFIPG